MWECLTVCQLGLAKVTSLEPWHLKVVPEFASSLFSEAPLNHLCLSSPLLVHHLLEAIFFFFRQEASYFHPPPQKKNCNSKNIWGEQFVFRVILPSPWSVQILTVPWKYVTAQNYSGTLGRVCGIWEWRHSSNAHVWV